jgi:hypothetical protein
MSRNHSSTIVAVNRCDRLKIEFYDNSSNVAVIVVLALNFWERFSTVDGHTVEIPNRVF